MDTSSGAGFGQPLASTGSCFADFDIQPVVECTSDKCEIVGDDSSIWMSLVNNDTSKTLSEFFPPGEIPLQPNTRDVTDYISRCAVCVSIYPWIAVHSFDHTVPACPQGEGGVTFNTELLWSGYSIVMARDRGGGVGQDMSSPGSCLEKFSPIMTVKCVPSGTLGEPNCSFQSPDAKTIFVRNKKAEYSEQIGPYPRGEQLHPQDYYVSRCSVCLIKP